MSKRVNHFLFIHKSNESNPVTALINSKYNPEIKIVGKLNLSEIDKDYVFKIKGEDTKKIEEYLNIQDKESKEYLLKLAKKIILLSSSC